MATTTRVVAALALATACLLPACEHPESGRAAIPGPSAVHDDRAGVTSLQPRSDDEEVIDRLASARCYRARVCSEVGQGRRYGPMNACLEHMRGSIVDDYAATACSAGIDMRALDECLNAIDSEGCGDGVAILNRTRRCRFDVLCVK